MPSTESPATTETVAVGTRGHTKPVRFYSLTNSCIDASDFSDGGGALLDLSAGTWLPGAEAVITLGTIRCTVNGNGELVVRSIDGCKIEVSTTTAALPAGS